MSIQAFISCRFPPSEVVAQICELLRPDVTPHIATDVKAGSLPTRIKAKIGESDCLVAILTEQGNSAFVQNEVGIAFALNKPIFAIYEEHIDVTGIQPYLSTFIKYPTGDLASIARDITSLKLAITQEVAAREIAGGPDEILQQLTQNGVQAIFPDRATSFRVFTRVWERENDIRIVGSSVEGFKRGIGIEARELIEPKLRDNKRATIHLLLTHASFAQYREGPEREPKGYIADQIRTTAKMLQAVRALPGIEDRLQWKYFKGAPTCFMIEAGSFMLLNPYLYMQPAYFNFSMIVKDTKSKFDIYNHYHVYHFQRAWDDPELSTTEPGFE
jgi:hypothetical protein